MSQREDQALANARATLAGAVESAGEGVQAAESFLQEVGTRVRNARTRHGMSRKVLARESGVSERYLAQLETGSGNISILLLPMPSG